VNAQVTFTTGAGTIQVDVVNQIVDPRSVIQNLSALAFTLSSGQSTGTLSSSSANRRTVSGGTFTDQGAASTGWNLQTYSLNSTAGLRLCVLCAAAGPAHTLIGAAGYGNANSSINGNGPHNPFLSGHAIYNLSVPGVTAQTVISRARFQFGTTDGSNFIDVTTALAVEANLWGHVKALYN
jgi:hypothetical protein